MTINLNKSFGMSGHFLNFALAGLSGGATTHSHTASVPHVINGIWGTAASGTTTPNTNSSATVPGAVTAAAAGAALAAVAPASGYTRHALVVWTLDVGGTKRIRSTGWFDALIGNPLVLPFPTIPDTEIPVAYHTVKLGSTLSGTFTYGGTNWNTAGVTVGTVVNVFQMPDKSGIEVTA